MVARTPTRRATSAGPAAPAPAPTRTSAAAAPPVHLPHLLREITDVFGAAMAEKLAAAYGGQYVYLPRRAVPSHPVAKATSPAVLAWLIQHHNAHARIVIPKGTASEAGARIAEAQRLRAEGLTVAEVAARLGVHVRTAHTYLRHARERGSR